MLKPGADLPPLSKRADKPPLPSWILPVVMLATLIIGGWFIIENLAADSKTEDCMMAGRRNCVPPIDTSKM
jgi:hypothetical protein